MSRWMERSLTRDSSMKSGRYVCVPSSRKDESKLYPKHYTEQLLKILDQHSRAIRPGRMIVLYVPSDDAVNLLLSLGFVCYMVPLVPKDDGVRVYSSEIGWRHSKKEVGRMVYGALRKAWRTTDALKAEVTDKRMSVFTLPAKNFQFPDRESTISEQYWKFVQGEIDMSHLRDRLFPVRFTRDQLPRKAFKGAHHSDCFFQDARGRVFPPDLYHGHVRDDEGVRLLNGLPRLLSRMYRFGVPVRNGNVHYDVQFTSGRELKGEPMYCAESGAVWVTASHANVGVNDVIWVPDGRKEKRNAGEK